MYPSGTGSSFSIRMLDWSLSFFRSNDMPISSSNSIGDERFCERAGPPRPPGHPGLGKGLLGSNRPAVILGSFGNLWKGFGTPGMIIVLLLGDPHLLEGGEGSKDGSS